MADLFFSMNASLDGYIADEEGRFDWAAPSPEVHAFINDLHRDVGTYLFGRRAYEVMTGWETLPLEGESPYMRDYAEIWRAADKVVYSTTLEDVSTSRTTLERSFDPERVREMKRSATRDLNVGGAGLAAEALRAGLMDELRLFVSPVIVGGGTRVLPDGIRTRLSLLDERRFENGTVYLRYRVER